MHASNFSLTGILFFLVITVFSKEGPHYFPYQENGKWGVIDQSGAKIIDAQYLNINFINEEKSPLLEVVTTAMDTLLIDFTGKTVLKINGYKNYKVIPDKECIFVSNPKNQKAIYKIREMKFVSDFGYQELEDIYYIDSLIYVFRSGRKGVFNTRSNKEIIPPVYSSVENIHSDNNLHLSCGKEGKFLLYDLRKNAWVSGPVPGNFYNKISKRYYILQKNRKFGVYDLTKNVLLLPFTYDRIDILNTSNLKIGVGEKYGIYNLTLTKITVKPICRRIDKVDNPLGLAWCDLIDSTNSHNLFDIDKSTLLVSSKNFDEFYMVYIPNDKNSKESPAQLLKNNQAFCCIAAFKRYVLQDYFTLSGKKMNRDSVDQIIKQNNYVHEKHFTMGNQSGPDGLSGPQQTINIRSLRIKKTEQGFVISGRTYAHKAVEATLTAYDTIYAIDPYNMEDSIFYARKAGKFGFVSYDGKEILPCQYDSLKFLSKSRYRQPILLEYQISSSALKGIVLLYQGKTIVSSPFCISVEQGRDPYQYFYFAKLDSMNAAYINPKTFNLLHPVWSFEKE